MKKRPAGASVVKSFDSAGDSSIGVGNQRPAKSLKPSQKQGLESRVLQDYAVSQRVVYTPAQGEARLGTVRWVGKVDGQPQTWVGIELDKPLDGCNKGLHPHSQEDLFTCDEGCGLFVDFKSSRLHQVEPAAAKFQRAAQKLKKLRVGLENLQESSTLRAAKAQQQAEVLLRAAAEVPGAEAWAPLPEYRKHWSNTSQTYLYYPRGQPLLYGSPTKPPGCSVSTVEGGPDSDSQYPVLGLPSLEDGKVTRAEACAVWERCANRWHEPLPSSFLLQLARTARELFVAESTVLRLQTPPKGRFRVIGDTHGHLKDVVHIWEKHGLPSRDNVYLFNGDICDRGDSERRGGQQALLVWACVLCFKLAEPGSIYMTRGNHEDSLYWRDDASGFTSTSFGGEMEAKYNREIALQLSDSFGDLCDVLPLAAVLDRRCLILHGGLPRQWTSPGAVRLAEVEQVQRPVAMPGNPESRAEIILFDITWSDPQVEHGIGPNDRGDGIISYGPDVTMAFLEAEGLGLLIRSHEVPGRQQRWEDRGFEWWHPRQHARKGSSNLLPLHSKQEGWCLTVFSASDYCGCYDTNLSSHVVFDGHATKMLVVEHSGADAEKTLQARGRLLKTPAPAKTANLEEQRSLAQGIFDRQIIEIIVKHKRQLLSEFMAADAGCAWALPIEFWLSCCCRILRHIPWSEYIMDPRIVPIRDGQVLYTNFLLRYQLRFRNRLGRHSGFRRALTNHLFESLMRADHTLRETLSLLDSDGDGFVSLKEFANVLTRFGRCLTPSQAEVLYRTTFASHGHIRVEDFLSALSVQFSFTNTKPSTPRNEFVPKLLDSICRELLGRAEFSSVQQSVGMVLRQFFERADSNCNGYLEVPEFVAALKSLRSCVGISEQDLEEVADYVGAAQGGHINYAELLVALGVRRSAEEVVTTNTADASAAVLRPGPEALLEDVLEAVYRVLHFEYARPLRAILRRWSSPPGCTRCTQKMFGEALRALNNGSFGGQLSEPQIQCLVNTLDTNSAMEADAQALAANHATFDFEDFFSSFQIVDTEAGEDLENHN